MTQENKELLLVDLCERLPYGVIVHFKGEYKKYHKVEEIDVRDEVVRCFEGMHLYEEGVINCFPYLRPMSSMNDKEKRELQSFYPGSFGGQWFDIEKGTIEIFECSSTITLYLNDSERIVDWLNRNMFDYRRLIERGLALEAPKEMYK